MRRGDDPSEAATILVAGGGRAGLGVATELAANGRPVTFVGDVMHDRGNGSVRVVSRRITDAASLRDVLATVGEVAAVVVTGADSEAFLVAHLARRELDGIPIVTFVDDPWRRCAFDELAVETLNTSTLLADAVHDRLQRTLRT